MIAAIGDGDVARPEQFASNGQRALMKGGGRCEVAAIALDDAQIVDRQRSPQVADAKMGFLEAKNALGQVESLDRSTFAIASPRVDEEIERLRQLHRLQTQPSLDLKAQFGGSSLGCGECSRIDRSSQVQYRRTDIAG